MLGGDAPAVVGGATDTGAVVGGIVDGGATGISLLINQITGYPLSIIFVFINKDCFLCQKVGIRLLNVS